jgi:hypothetical protein
VIRVKALIPAVLVAVAFASAGPTDEGAGVATHPEDDEAARVTAGIYAGFINFARGPAEVDERYWGYRFDAVLDIPTDKWARASV